DDLDYSTKTDGAAPFVIEKFRGQQKQCWTNSFTATIAQIFADFSNRFNARNSIASKLTLDSSQIFAQQLEEFFRVNGDVRAQLRDLSGLRGKAFNSTGNS